MNELFWIPAFLGIILIYAAGRLTAKSENPQRTETLIKLVGILISAASLIALWATDSFR